MSRASWVKYATERLNSPDKRVDALGILAHITKCSLTEYYLHPDEAISAEEEAKLEAALAQRIEGYPMAYIRGTKGFWSMELRVNSSTLIPRPETECLVEWILHRHGDDSLCFADLGVGSGAILLALLKERSHWQGLGVDKSEQALAVAKENAHTHGISKAAFKQGHWLNDVNDTFDFIVANPPYVCEDDPHLQTDIRFEPEMALVSGHDGLQDIRQIAQAAMSHLKPGGWLYLEHGYDQQFKVRDILEQGGYEQIMVHDDLAGITRFSAGRREMIC